MNLELNVMLAPATGWTRAMKEPAGHWLARPLFFLLVFGCAASLSVSGRVTARLALPAAISMSFIPLAQAVSLAVVCRGRVPLRRAVDLFSIGNAPWLLLLLAFAGTWAFVPSATVYEHFDLWRDAFMALFVWSAWMDLQFFRVVTGRRPVGALFVLAAQRLICWGLALSIFVGPAGVQVVEGWFTE